jgi:methylphosphotriester-DNA--protein-cysteine methyltransferase
MPFWNLDRLKLSKVRKEFAMNKTIEIEKLANATMNDSRRLAVVKREKTADGTFYYSVKTTGVYCRPSCAARLARPQNVLFHQTPEDAERVGFRACKRCKPKGPSQTKENAEKISKVCRLIDRSENSLSLDQLAKYAGMSVFHLHRTFKAVTGLTPSGYAAAHRSYRVRRSLEKKLFVIGNERELVSIADPIVSLDSASARTLFGVAFVSVQHAAHQIGIFPLQKAFSE